ncbi:ATP-binding cassette domain-containing protein [Candidatus Pantoea persica]|uniref:ATP-binding cassette domain-containing protein n=1 Tax=Candidatus Pantoea persica TaxID=2518128 RepID=UPI00215DB42C|nr:ATP-binding cassette domain-containing protein [Candidatus Pantoea persica]MBA2816943.1 Vitamin B12 import ATP-binding protein BtuD [Candidatus Pantoea persica]
MPAFPADWRRHAAALVGPNGAGKSTLLARMAELLAGEGDVCLLARPHAWLPQQSPPGIMPVYHYLRLHLADRQSEMRLTALLDRLQLQDKLTRLLAQLSGSEWQRVRLAAVFAQIDPAINPQGKVLILDEPMTGLDIASKKGRTA